MGIEIGLLVGWLLTATDVPSSPHIEKHLTPDVERAIDRGLEFLAKQQKKKGSIGDPPVASTGIALLAFLANGHLPGKGLYGQTVERGVKFLLDVQHPYTGMLGSSMYEHGFALLALADVWGEMKDDEQRLQDGIERAVELALSSQKMNPTGGWHYSPQMQSADISVTSAVLQAMRASREAFFEVPETTMQRAAAFVLSCANKDGGFAYTPSGGAGGSNVARTGIGVLSLLACGQSQRPEVLRGVAWLKKHPQLSEMPSYASYYAVLAMYQARTLAGESAWNEWYPKIQAQILKAQKKNGSFQGGLAGPEVDSGLMLIALSIQKGLLPLFQR